jgi:hypothetical protein
MKSLDLRNALKQYSTGWVLIDEDNKKVIAHARDFEGINKSAMKIASKNMNVFIMPASESYFGFVT